MKKIITFLLMLIALKEIYAEKMIIKIPYTSIENIQELIYENYDIAHILPNKEIHLVVTENEKNHFLNLYPETTILFTEKDLRENLQSSVKSIQGYHTYSEIVSILHNYAELYPEICQVIELGPSQGKIYYDNGNQNYENYNHTIYALKLSDNVTEYEDQPNYYFMGTLHAREPLSAEVCMTILEDLINSYNANDSEHPVNQSQIWFIPVVNPDGHEVVLSLLDIWHRKTIFDNNNNGQFDFQNGTYGNNVDGIDGNRDFSYKWGTTGISWSFNSATYPGTEPFSAVETSYIRDLAQEIPFVAGISYHTYGNLVLYPLGYAYGKDSHNIETISSLAIELANLTPQFYNPSQGYTPMPAWELYPASGSSEDYMYYQHNILAFTFELANVFIPNANEVQVICQNNIPAAYHLLSRHKNKFLTGTVTNQLTGEPVKAEILVYPIDAFQPERASIFSDLYYGRYHYALMPGSYQLIVKAEGYSPFYSNFQIFETEQTVINIALTPAELYSVSLKLEHSTAPNIFSNIPVIFEHITVDTLFTNQYGVVNVNNLSPGEITIIAKANNQETYITDIFLSDNDLSYSIYDNEIIIRFNDYDFIETFQNPTQIWQFNNWTVTNLESYLGDNSACLNNYVNNASLISQYPIVIPAEEKTYINFMAKFASEMQNYNYIEFSISENSHNWITLQQIRQTTDWENFYYIIPANTFNQVYFKFTFKKSNEGSQPESNFYLDLFCVNVGQALVSDSEITEVFPNLFLIDVYPNPFNSKTNFVLNLKSENFVKIDIFNIKGQFVESIVNNTLSKGKHQFLWNLNNKNKNLSSGIYFYKINVDNQHKYGKIVLLK